MQSIRVAPLESEDWPALERLFGERGACAGCWCMYWRLPRSVWSAGCGEPNRRALRRLVRSGASLGVLAWRGQDAVGWCAVQPKEAYPALARSRRFPPPDARPVWSITCFYVDPASRGRGLMTLLLAGALRHARAQGARLVEAYPADPRGGRLRADAAYQGTRALFEQAGFREAGRGPTGRTIHRRALRASRAITPR